MADPEDIYRVPVADLLEHWDPFGAWDTPRVDIVDIDRALVEGRLQDRPYEQTMLWYDHAARIAYMVRHPDRTPIQIDVGCPALGYPLLSPFTFIDGNHRLCAASYRGDQSILISYEGECDRFVELFPAAQSIFPCGDAGS